MGEKTNAEIIDREEIILEDGSNVIFTTAVLSDETQNALPELSEFVPQLVKHIIPVTNDSKFINISGITGLIGVDYAKYKVDKEPVQRRSVKIWGDELELDLQKAPSATSKGTLTGTLTFTTDSTAVSGSSTLFTTELEVGFYIQTSGGSTWYRIASITDATNLVLTAVAESDDNGADTADSSKYWFEYAWLFCRKVHTLTTLTDLAGAIDLVVGYDAGSVLIHVDALGSGTIPKNTILTIAGVPDSYRVTADATIGSNEVDINISPGLTGRAPNNAVVTIRPSSLTPELERLLTELAAARTALNWVGDTRTSIDAVRVILNTANTAFDLIAARITQGVADLTSGRGEITDKRSDADTEFGKVAARITDSITDITNALTYVDVVNTGADPMSESINAAIARLSAAGQDMTLGRAYLSEHGTGTSYMNLAAREFQGGNSKIGEGRSYISEVMARLSADTQQLTRLQTWAKYKLQETQQSLRRLAKPRQKFYGYSRA